MWLDASTTTVCARTRAVRGVHLRVRRPEPSTQHRELLTPGHRDAGPSTGAACTPCKDTRP